VGAEVKSNIRPSQVIPRVLVAVGLATIGAVVPGALRRSFLMGGAAALLATVATGYCPINAALDQVVPDEPHWRTIKTYRVAT
jgi:hypothetical protein